MTVPYAYEGLCLHQSQVFCWAIAESLPTVAWEEVAAGSSRVHPGLSWHQVWHLLFAGTVTSAAGVVFGSKQLLP
jgi:hypothetical protein